MFNRRSFNGLDKDFLYWYNKIIDTILFIDIETSVSYT